MSLKRDTLGAPLARGKEPVGSTARAESSSVLRRTPLAERPSASAGRLNPPASSVKGSSRPSSVASFAAARTSDASPAMSRRRKIEDLVLATVPAARARRSETDQRVVKDREDLRVELVDLVEDILKSRRGEGIEALDQTYLEDRLKRYVTQRDADVGSGSNVRLDSTISKLRRQSDVTRIYKGLMVLMNELSFSSRVAASVSGSTSDAAPRSRLAARDTPRSIQEPLAAQLDSRETRDDHTSRVAVPRSAPEEVSEARSTATSALLQERELSTSDRAPVSNAEMLRKRREVLGQQQLDEALIVRDVIYLLQGIDGTYVRFEDTVLSASNDVGEVRDAAKLVQITFANGAEKSINGPTKQLIHQIAELGRLYKRIDDFLQQHSHQRSKGLVMQSLCHFLASDMTDYYRLIAILEAQMKSRTSSTAEKGTGLTLRRIAAWTHEITLRMRLMSTVIESCQNAHGGAILSLIHSYTFHGDPLIQKYTAEVLEHVSKPFFHILSLWIFDGELQDPFDEFFVAKKQGIDEASRAAESESKAVDHGAAQEHELSTSSLWQKQYHFRPEMLPSFLDEAFGKKIFSAGKSLNFIRFSCGDAQWTAMPRFGTDSNLRSDSLRYADLSGLERNIDAAYESASERLLDILMNKFKLMAHLGALKDYLMLTKGDFTDLLLESIGPSLDKPASSLFRHNLTASLETTIRGSNSQYDDVDIVGRLDARILDFQEGDLGWDSFTLEYRVDEPISTILDAHALAGYQVIFNHLWKMKRVESTLSRCWESLLLAANLLRRAQPRCAARLPLSRRAKQASEERKAVERSEQDGEDKDGRALYKLTHHALGHLCEQLHFVKQMQGFISLEVIEYSWNDLSQLFANRASKTHLIDLDELISSHRAYLNALIAKVMLRGSSTGSTTKRSDQLTHEVRTLMDTMLASAVANEDLARYVVDAVAQKGLEASHHRAPDHNSPSSLANVRARLQSTQSKFQSSAQVIIAKLERHSNLVVRDLATRLNFNSYYTTASQHPAANSSGTGVANDN